MKKETEKKPFVFASAHAAITTEKITAAKAENKKHAEKPANVFNMAMAIKWNASTTDAAEKARRTYGTAEKITAAINTEKAKQGEKSAYQFNGLRGAAWTLAYLLQANLNAADFSALVAKLNAENNYTPKKPAEKPQKAAAKKSAVEQQLEALTKQVALLTAALAAQQSAAK